MYFLSDVAVKLSSMLAKPQRWREIKGRVGLESRESKTGITPPIPSQSLARAPRLSITLFHTNYYPHWAGDGLACRPPRKRETPPGNPRVTDWEGSLAVICAKASERWTSVLRNVRAAPAFMLTPALLTLIWCTVFSPQRQYYPLVSPA